MTPSAKSCGDRVRDLLGDAQDVDALVEAERPAAERCGYHLPLERKIERLGTAMAFLGDAIEEVRQGVRSLHKSNGAQNADIAVLKTKAALYGGVAAAVIAPLSVVAVELVLKKLLGW